MVQIIGITLPRSHPCPPQPCYTLQLNLTAGTNGLTIKSVQHQAQSSAITLRNFLCMEHIVHVQNPFPASLIATNCHMEHRV